MDKITRRNFARDAAFTIAGAFFLGRSAVVHAASGTIKPAITNKSINPIWHYSYSETDAQKYGYCIARDQDTNG